MFRVLPYLCHRDLMRTEGPFNWKAVHKFRAGPSFRGTEYNHRPLWSATETLYTSAFLNLHNSVMYFFNYVGHFSMHLIWIFTLYEINIVA